MNATIQHVAERHATRVASRIVNDARPRPRDLREFQDFYRLWCRPVFTFCLLACGDRRQAEWLTEETFAWYFRHADFVALRRSPQIPVGLLRSAADLASNYGSRRQGVASADFNQALLEQPFKERASFILVSLLSVHPSAAAVALRLSSSRLAQCFLRAAFELRARWQGVDDPLAMRPAA